MRGMMRLALLGVPGRRGATSPFGSYLATSIADGSLPVWLSLDETGTVVKNWGSAGSAANGVADQITQQAGGIISPSHAAAFNGTTSAIPTSIDSGWVPGAAVTIAALVRLDGLGGGRQGYIVIFSDRLIFYTNDARQIRVWLSGNKYRDFAQGERYCAWAWYFMTYNDAGDRRPRVYLGMPGAITELSPGAAAYSGTLSAASAATIGNRPDRARGLVGRLDEVLIYNRVIQTAEMQNIVTLTMSQDNISAMLVYQRQYLIDNIWRDGAGVPTAGADTVEQDVVSPLTADPTNLDHVDRLTFNLGDNVLDPGNDVLCQPYVWYPDPLDDNGLLVIYHYGHTNDYNAVDGERAEVIRRLVQDGYTVCGVLMPFGGDTTTHNLLPDPTDTFNPLVYFIDPVLRIVNALSGSFDGIYMVGMSGGAWTTSLCAAIDERISRSVQIAGTLPLACPSGSRDWEQFLPGLAPEIDYSDLYILATTSGRRQLQMLVSTDPTGFHYTHYFYAPYADGVADWSESIGGSWQLVWDDTQPDHTISEFTYGVFIPWLAEGRFA